MPLEVEIPSLRVLIESELEEAEWAKVRYEQLNMISEKRLAAICHHSYTKEGWPKHMIGKYNQENSKKGILYYEKSCHYQVKTEASGHQTMKAHI